MERRVLLAILLTFLVLYAWNLLNPAPDPIKPEDGKGIESVQTDPNTPNVGAGSDPSSPSTPGAVPAVPGVRVVGDAPAASQFILQNESLRLEIDSMGAAVRTGYLLGHDGEAEGEKTAWSETWFEGKLPLLRTYQSDDRALDLFFDDEVTEKFLSRSVWTTAGPEADGSSIKFELEVQDQGTRYVVSKRFRLLEAAHRVEVEVGLRVVEGNGVTRNMWLQTSSGVLPPDRATAAVTPRSLLVVRDGDDIDVEAVTPNEVLEKQGRWRVPRQDTAFVCDVGVYFGSYLRRVDKTDVLGARFLARSTEASLRDDLEVAGPTRVFSQLGFSLQANAGAEESVARFDYYVGPKDYRVVRESYADNEPLRRDYLEIADHELTQQAFCCVGPLTIIVDTISKVILKALDAFLRLFGNMGLAIIFLTLCVRALMFPITRKSQVAMAKHGKNMARVKPKLEALKEKYGDDKKKFAEEQMKLMKSEKVQLLPVGGCLPIFLQIPVFFGLFSAIRFDIDLRHASFLWCNDLSLPDNVFEWTPFALPCCFGPGIIIDGIHVFPILMTFAWFVNQKMMPRSPDPQMAQQQKMMLAMPFLFGFMLYSYAAGLSLYWLTSSLVGIFEQRVIKKFFPIDSAPEESAPIVEKPDDTPPAPRRMKSRR